MTVIHDTLLNPVHVQPAPADTLIVPDDAADVVRFTELGEIDHVHGAVYAKVFVRGVDAVPPGPTAFTTAS